MKLIISPAKKMNYDDSLPYRALPVLLEQTEKLRQYMLGQDYAAAKELWKCNDDIAQLNYDRFQKMSLTGNLTPAILAYEGIQYQYMSPGTLETEALEWLEQHLRILSGFYGVLRPFDGVTAYRLELQAKAGVENAKDLYAFWSDTLYQSIMEGDRVVLNLASKEYSKAIERYLRPGDTFITCIFAERKGDKLVQRATLAKMARGEMVRFLAENGAEAPEKAKEFTGLGFAFDEANSTATEYVFIK